MKDTCRCAGSCIWLFRFPADAQGSRNKTSGFIGHLRSAIWLLWARIQSRLHLIKHTQSRCVFSCTWTTPIIKPSRFTLWLWLGTVLVLLFLFCWRLMISHQKETEVRRAAWWKFCTFPRILPLLRRSITAFIWACMFPRRSERGNPPMISFTFISVL